MFRGYALSAHLIGLPVLYDNGMGSTSDVIAALEFATANREALGIDVINLSLGHPPYAPAASDPLVQAVEAASRAGIVVVVAAGNLRGSPLTKPRAHRRLLFPAHTPPAPAGPPPETMGTLHPPDDPIAN